MNSVSVPIKETATVRVESTRVPANESSATAKLSWQSLIPLPLACVAALAIHFAVKNNDPEPNTTSYAILLGGVLGLGIILSFLQFVSGALRRWMEHMCPIIAAAIGSLAVWELVTSGLRWLPLPYFPSPASVLRTLIFDWDELFKGTWHSLALLLSGYVLGAVLGVTTGICVGWFRRARYWGMPLLKVVGPIPATAWIPLAMVISPKPIFSAVGLIALAVWFPVTMLTMSGIANTRASYLDVARTLGASPSFLIFRVAIPAAMPSIFIGLFMGLGASFLTLIVAETVGVRAGLGWYVGWAQGWAEYSKVYAALVIMAAFFSTIMTLLFKLRDRVLVWQKGTIKW